MDVFLWRTLNAQFYENLTQGFGTDTAVDHKRVEERGLYI